MTPWLGQAPRRWQAEALPVALDALASGQAGVVVATMGSGKSILQAELVARYRETHPGARVIVSAPTEALVEQLAATFRARMGRATVGVYYGRTKEPRCSVVVCCAPSLRRLVGEVDPPDLWVADECHRTEAPTVLAAVETMQPKARIGFSATPFLGSEGRTLSLWDAEIYSYNPGDALRDGVIVPPRVIDWGEERGEPPEMDEASLLLMAEHDVRALGPGVANACDKVDAERFAETLRDAGYRAEALYSGGRIGTDGKPSTAPKPDKGALLERLRTGALDVVVHVEMLTEGVDMPWLRWMLLRRGRGKDGRVDHAQEVGRALRAYPGKADALIIDPGGLFDRFGLSAAAALGWIEPAPVTPRGEVEETSERSASAPPPVVMATSVGRWSRALIRGLEMDGLSAGSDSGVSRSSKPTGPQLKTLRKMVNYAKRIGDERVEGEVRAAIRLAERLTRGEASDLISTLMALAAQPSWTRWIPSLPVPGLDVGMLEARVVAAPVAWSPWSPIDDAELASLAATARSLGYG